jgi:hypothetical protein
MIQMVKMANGALPDNLPAPLAPVADVGDGVISVLELAEGILKEAVADGLLSLLLSFVTIAG